MTKDNNKKRPTIRTVAEHTGLSPTTVSLALRGDDSIPLETRNRVINAANELNYKFVPRKKKIEKKQIKRLVYVIKDYGDQPVIANPFYGQVLSGAEQACREEDTNLSLIVMDHNYPETSELPAALTSDVDGIIMSSPYPLKLIDRIGATCDCPIVLIDNHFPGVNYDTVMADDYGGGYQMAQHLIALGHTRIAVITSWAGSPEIPPSFRERYRGYADACTAANIEPLSEAIIPQPIASPYMDNGNPYREWLTQYIADNPDVTALFAVGDFLAIATVQMLQGMRYSIPADYSVAGFDDFEMASMIDPPLTTVHIYKRAMGHAAILRLIARSEGNVMPPLKTLVGVELVVRSSTGQVNR
jgi:LacI family transcriptional regulator